MQQTTFSPPSRMFWAIAALIVLAGFGLRTWRLGDASLWYDENFTATVVDSRAERFFPFILESGVQAPLYYIVQRPFNTESELLLRLPSVLFGTASIPLLMAVTVRLYKNYHLALLAAALLASNPYHIWLSRTARPYALLFVMALLASYFFAMLLLKERTRANWIGFTLSSMAAYATHYFALALPMAQYVLFAFILRGNRGFFRRWFYAQLIAGIPLLIWAISLMQQETVAFGLGWIPSPAGKDIVLTLWNMLVGYDGSAPWYIIPGLLAVAAGLILGAFYAVRERKTNRVDFYWFWQTVAPLSAVFVISLFRPIYADRYFIVFLPALLLLVARGWQRLPRPGWSGALVVMVVVAGVSSVMITVERKGDQREDWRSATRFVEQKQQSGDGLLFEDPMLLISFLRYFEGNGMPRAWLLNGQEWTGQYTEPVARVWAVYHNPNDNAHIQGVLPAFDPFEPADSPMAAWLIERRGQVIEQKAFNGLTVLLVDVAAELAEAKD